MRGSVFSLRCWLKGFPNPPRPCPFPSRGGLEEARRWYMETEKNMLAWAQTDLSVAPQDETIDSEEWCDRERKRLLREKDAFFKERRSSHLSWVRFVFSVLGIAGGIFAFLVDRWDQRRLRQLELHSQTSEMHQSIVGIMDTEDRHDLEKAYDLVRMTVSPLYHIPFLSDVSEIKLIKAGHGYDEHGKKITDSSFCPDATVFFHRSDVILALSDRNKEENNPLFAITKQTDSRPLQYDEIERIFTRVRDILKNYQRRVEVCEKYMQAVGGTFAVNEDTLPPLIVDFARLLTKHDERELGRATRSAVYMFLKKNEDATKLLHRLKFFASAEKDMIFTKDYCDLVVDEHHNHYSKSKV